MGTGKEAAKQIGARMTAAREEAGLSRADVGAALGLSERGYGHLEAGRHLLSIEYLLQLPRILGKPVTYFLPTSAVSEAERQNPMLDPLLQEVVEAWPKLDQVGRESVRNMAQLMRERAEAQRLLAEEKAESGEE
jgi:transcriptional regulator with XRE-family HTH domain